LNNIIAIIVSYNPDLHKIEKTISSIINQISLCIIIDNGNTKFEYKNNKNIIVINLLKNYGIAYAQNKGIQIAKKQKADFIILSDQDTIYPNDYIEKNMAAYKELINFKLAALVPTFFNTVKNQKNPVMLTKFIPIMDFNEKYIKTAHAISSGTFIVATSLDEIGGMNEKLFIDYVDFEWCWRAITLGYKIYTISDLIIKHQLGDNAKKRFDRVFTVRSDIRYFYMIRNGCYLAIYSPYLKWYEKILLLKRVFIHTIGVAIEKRNIDCLHFISKALLDGLLNKMS